MKTIRRLINKFYPLCIQFTVISTNKVGARYRHLECVPCCSVQHAIRKVSKKFPNSTIIPPWQRDQNLNADL